MKNETEEERIELLEKAIYSKIKEKDGKKTVNYKELKEAIEDYVYSDPDCEFFLLDSLKSMIILTNVINMLNKKNVVVTCAE